jgi:3-methyladenine DNA glycosylase AlkD
MAAYMKHHFAFLGIAMPARVAALKPIWKTWQPTRLELLALVEDLWALPEREYQYAALAALERHWKLLTANDLKGLSGLVASQQTWWDTIDPFSSHIAGGMVRRSLDNGNSSLAGLMDGYAVHPNQWLRRIAILHQLRYRRSTDAERLFGYALENASHPSFWIRKALGWALREYAKTDASAVLEFVERFDGVFSKLTVREALKHL